MEQNIQLNCEIVRDLLPLYHDKVVSKETETAVENHLDVCGECLQEYNKISAELPVSKIAKSKADIGKILKRIRSKAFLKGALVTCLIVAAIIGGYFSLFKLKISTISAEDITIEHAYKTEDGIFLMYSMSRFGGVDISVKEEGNSLELVFKEAVFNISEEPDRISYYFNYEIENCDSFKINGKSIELETENVPEYVSEYLNDATNASDSDKQIIGECFYESNSTIHYHYSNGTEKIWNIADGTLIYEGEDRND